MPQTLDTTLMPESINGRDKLLKLAEVSPSKVKKKLTKHHNTKRNHAKVNRCDLSFTENISHLVNRDVTPSKHTECDQQNTSSNQNDDFKSKSVFSNDIQSENNQRFDSLSPSDLKISDLRISDYKVSSKNELKSRIPQSINRQKYNDNFQQFTTHSHNLSKQQSQIPVYNTNHLHANKINNFQLRHLNLITPNNSLNNHNFDLNQSHIPVYKPITTENTIRMPLTLDNESTNQYYSVSSHTNSLTNPSLNCRYNRRYSYLDTELPRPALEMDHSPIIENPQSLNYLRNSFNSSTKSKLVKSRSYNIFNRHVSKDTAHRYQSRLRQDSSNPSYVNYETSSNFNSCNSSQHFNKMLTRLDTFYVLDEESFTDSPKKILNPELNNSQFKPADCVSPPERSFLKECQKNALFQINDIRKTANKQLDQVFKSSSCDNLDDFNFDLMKKPKSETDLMTSKNNLSGLTHLEKDVPESMLNKFRKSFSHHFTKQNSAISTDRSSYTNYIVDKCNEMDINQNICVIKNCEMDIINGKMSTIERRKSKVDFLNRKSLRRSYKRNVYVKRSLSQPNKSDDHDNNNSDQCSEYSDHHSRKFENVDDMYESSMRNDNVIYAEAIFDHLSSDSEELSFLAGDLIDVTDASHKQWWWGAIKTNNVTKYGWFQSSYVRLKVSQEETLEEALANSQENVELTPKKRMSLSKISSEQVRANVVLEIINTERDFVKNLKDVIDGYLKPCRDRKDMFDETRIMTIFGNIEELFEFQTKFLTELEQCVVWENLSQSQIGNCFLNNEKAFSVYGEFCKNHHLAISELQDLYTDHKYVVFFEGCRLLQNMIDISLDGFLLTPIQKICKYPLQLGELLKYTRADHPDFEPISSAYKCMQRVAQFVNERKRRFENLEQLITYQESFENWEGPLLLNTCSLLIHSGDITRITRSSWSKDITLLLFDHLLIICKKDTRILKKGSYIFKSRIEMDHVEEIISLDDNTKDGYFNVVTKNAFKFFYTVKQKWYMFQAKTASDKDKWISSFEEERRRVKEDHEQGFYVSEQDIKGARLAHQSKLKPKKPKARRPFPIVKKPDTVITEIPLDPVNGFEIDRNRAGSLPSYIFQDKQAINLYKNRQSTLHKKARSNWFQLGSNKKNRLKRTLK